MSGPKRQIKQSSDQPEKKAKTTRGPYVHLYILFADLPAEISFHIESYRKGEWRRACLPILVPKWQKDTSHVERMQCLMVEFAGATYRLRDSLDRGSFRSYTSKRLDFALTNLKIRRRPCNLHFGSA